MADADRNDMTITTKKGGHDMAHAFATTTTIQTTRPIASCPRFDLQTAYRISEEVSARTPKELFWALDRFDFDKAETEDGQHQRHEACQRIALELDRRGVAVRDPRLPSTYPGSPV
jgi:hypothetical protein